MTYRTRRRALQTAIAIAGLVPVGAGLAGVLMGPQMAGHADGAALDSHYRYLSGLLLSIGLLFWSAVPAIERRGPLVRALTVVVVVGGLARLTGLLVQGWPGWSMALALVMELAVTPLLCLWQFDVERRARLV